MKSEADKAYALLCSLAEDTSQSPLVRILARDARNFVSSIVLELTRDIEKRVK